MKITSIKREEGSYGVYLISLKANKVEKFFWLKDRVERIRDTGSTYTFGGGHVYVRQSGETLDPHSYLGKAVDRWRNKF